MATCKSCNKSGFFLRVSINGLCDNCKSKIVKDVYKRAGRIDHYHELSDNENTLKARLKLLEDVIQEAEALRLYENKGIATVSPLPSEIIRKTNLKIEKINNKINEDYGSCKNIEIKVSGVSHDNEDGSSRQEILRRCKKGEELEFKNSPFEGHPEAVKILRKNGEQIGWVSNHLAPDIAKWLKQGNLVEGSIEEILEPDFDSGNVYGCSIFINVYYKKPGNKKVI